MARVDYTNILGSLFGSHTCSTKKYTETDHAYTCPLNYAVVFAKSLFEFQEVIVAGRKVED